ncbi:MAG: hypothetical protein OEZ38_03525 [Gammaproteobacteria bacterium]|nr:hypothetical protein [Gammaproteobacteria bacterium]
MTDYHRQQNTMKTVLIIAAAVITLNIVAITTGVAKNQYSELHSWISANLN